MSIDYRRPQKESTFSTFRFANPVERLTIPSGLTVSFPDPRYPEHVTVNHVEEESMPAWSGEGLPPVGVECEYLWQWSDEIVYVRIKVLSHDEERAQFRVISGGGIGSLRECNQRLEDGLPMFRPIRTPEQIAADDRRSSAIALYGAVMDHSGQAFDRLPKERQEHYLKLVDQGWQQVPRA